MILKNQEKIMKHYAMLMLLMTVIFSLFACSDDDNDTLTEPERVGWAIGYREDNTAAILHTENGGLIWEEQGDPSLWKGMTGNDISAVDEQTAWAAVGSDETGAILHTDDGGVNWELQRLPEGVTDVMKGIKGLSREVAWAVTLTGIVMQTLDGGETWTVIPHDGIAIKQVNRMDAKGDEIWIADYGSGEKGMIHSPDFGQTWYRETLNNPDPSQNGFGPMAVSIVDSQVAWAATRPDANIFRTLDGGNVWRLDAPDVSDPNDLDDICAPDADTVWAVQNRSGGGGGNIIRVQLADGKVISDIMSPKNYTAYEYEGVTCFDENTAWVVGIQLIRAFPDLPAGIILHTTDGGKNWTRQTMWVTDVGLWKVSFVGAHR